MIFAIGDIHGEITKLRSLINEILNLDTNPEFVFIGDYLDKGEDSKSTLDYLIELENQFTSHFLIGNHEFMWLNYKLGDNRIENYLMKYGGKQTISSFGAEYSLNEVQLILKDKYKGFFQKLKPYWFNDNYFISHSGIKPSDKSLSPEDIKVEDFLFNRYDFIKMEDYFHDRKVIFGHTGFYQPYYDGYKIGLDTAACFLEDQPLTAFNLNDEYFIDSNKLKMPLSEFRLDISPCIPRVKPWRT